MSNDTQTSGDARYVIPALAPVYARLAPFAETLLCVAVGVAFVIHGWPKIQNPLGAVERVQSIGFYPGWLWASALAATEFFGGLLLIFGLLTRPAAMATAVMLLVTVWFHWVQLDQGYKGAELSIIWASVTLFFALNGAGRYSVDRVIGREI